MIQQFAIIRKSNIDASGVRFGSEARVVLQRLYTPQTNLGTTIASQYFEKSIPIDN